MTPRRIRWAAVWLGLLLVTLIGAAAAAHEVRPGYLELSESAPNRFAVVWKQPLRAGGSPGIAGRRLRIDPVFPDSCLSSAVAPPELTSGALLERFSLDCADGLVGQSLGVDGLARTLTDVLLRIHFRDGRSLTHLLRPESPTLFIAPEQSSAVLTYLRMGVEHLIFGYDHILFVVGLLFLVRGPRQLLQVVTSFTVAHSITLALSSLNVLTLAPAPVEAGIALSLLFLASELMRPRVQRSPLASRRPWLMSFGFGLLHGFGFAGALAEIGLPGDAAALALLLFNLGVEIGQLLIIAAVLGGVWLVGIAGVRVPSAVVRAPIVLMGVLSAYWLIERVARFV